MHPKGWPLYKNITNHPWYDRIHVKYLPFIEYLTSKGYIVVGHDQLGHGNSFTNSDDKGYFGEPDPNNLLIQDIHTLRQMTQEKYKNIPYFMLGHSMGSYLLREYIYIFVVKICLVLY